MNLLARLSARLRRDGRMPAPPSSPDAIHAVLDNGGAYFTPAPPAARRIPVPTQQLEITSRQDRADGVRRWVCTTCSCSYTTPVGRVALRPVAAASAPYAILTPGACHGARFTQNGPPVSSRRAVRTPESWHTDRTRAERSEAPPISGRRGLRTPVRTTAGQDRLR